MSSDRVHQAPSTRRASAQRCGGWSSYPDSSNSPETRLQDIFRCSFGRVGWVCCQWGYCQGLNWAALRPRTSIKGCPVLGVGADRSIPVSRGVEAEKADKERPRENGCPEERFWITNRVRVGVRDTSTSTIAMTHSQVIVWYNGGGNRLPFT